MKYFMTAPLQMLKPGDKCY